MKHLITISIAALLLSANLVAQQKEETKKSKFQISFGYPLGTHGSDTNYSNDYSFNILYGINSGVNKFEFGSIFNYNKGNVKGFQMSGVANINKFDTKGFQMSTANITYGNLNGVQLGTFNLAKNVTGSQIGVFNLAKNVKGLQIGVFNYSKKVKGLQIGVFNYRENSDDGLSIGLLNIIKNGYYVAEVTTGEVMYANTNYKMGSKKFYTIFKLGYSSFKSKPIYSYGVGFGRVIPFSEKIAVNTELSYNKIVHDNDWSVKKNDLYKLDINYNLQLANKFSLVAGPSLNYYNTNKKVDGEFGTLKLPYTIFEKTNTNSKQFFWVGFNFGINYKF